MAVVAPAAAAALLAVDIAETVLIQIVGQIVAGVVGSALAPELDAIRYAAYNALPGTRLSPQEAALAVVKGHLAQSVAQTEAQASGVSSDRFAVMVAGAGNPPPADFLLQLARRGIIPIADGLGSASTSAEQGIKESFVHPKWISTLEQGQWQLPSLGAVIEARLRNYITPDQFQNLTQELGFKTDASHLEYIAAGVPISPQEGYAAFHRGLIAKDDTNPDVPSLAQVFRESRINDKYLDVWMALQENLPPPRTITALLRAGSITQAMAKDLFHKDGLPDYLIQAYIDDASHQKTAAAKELSRSEVLAMYATGELTSKEAHDFLVGEGLTEDDAGFLLGYEDFKLVKAQVDALVSRVRTYFVGHKISKQDASGALARVGMKADLINRFLTVWEQEANASPTLLTVAQLVSAAKEGVLDVTAVFDELQGRGLDARDAYVHLAIGKADVSSLAKPAGVI